MLNSFKPLCQNLQVLWKQIQGSKTSSLNFDQKTALMRYIIVVLMIFGRRDWIRTNDPHHVKVVL
jgi:hypothetical protein